MTGELIIAKKQILIIFIRNSIILDQGFYMKKRGGGAETGFEGMRKVLLGFSQKRQKGAESEFKLRN